MSIYIDPFLKIAIQTEGTLILMQHERDEARRVARYWHRRALKAEARLTEMQQNYNDLAVATAKLQTVYTAALVKAESEADE